MSVCLSVVLAAGPASTVWADPGMWAGAHSSGDPDEATIQVALWDLNEGDEVRINVKTNKDDIFWSKISGDVISFSGNGTEKLTAVVRYHEGNARYVFSAAGTGVGNGISLPSFSYKVVKSAATPTPKPTATPTPEPTATPVPTQAPTDTPTPVPTPPPATAASQQTSDTTQTTAATTAATTTKATTAATTTTKATTTTTTTAAATTTAKATTAATTTTKATTTTTTTTKAKETKETTTTAEETTTTTSEETTTAAPVILPAGDDTVPSDPTIPSDPSDGGYDGMSDDEIRELYAKGGKGAAGGGFVKNNAWIIVLGVLVLLLVGRYVYLNKIKDYTAKESAIRMIPGVPALYCKATGNRLDSQIVLGSASYRSGSGAYNTASAMKELKAMETSEVFKPATPKAPVKRPASASVNQAQAGHAFASSGTEVNRPGQAQVSRPEASKNITHTAAAVQAAAARPAKKTPIVPAKEPTDMDMDEQIAQQKAEEAMLAAKRAAEKAEAAKAAAEKAAAEAAAARKAAADAEKVAEVELKEQQVKHPGGSVISSGPKIPSAMKPAQEAPTRPVWEKPQRQAYSTPFKQNAPAPAKEQEAPPKPVWERGNDKPSAKAPAQNRPVWAQKTKEAQAASKSQPKPTIPVWEKAKIKDPAADKQASPTKPVWEQGRKETSAPEAKPEANKPVWANGRTEASSPEKPKAEPKIPIWEQAKTMQVTPDSQKAAPTKPVWEQEKKDTSYRASISKFEHRRPDSDEMNALGSALVKDRVAPAASERKKPVRANWDNYARSGSSPFKPIDQGQQETGGAVPGFAPAPGAASATPAAAGSAAKVRANKNTDEPTSFTSGSSRKAAFFSKAKHGQSEPREETESAYGGIRRPNGSQHIEEESSAPALGKALEGKRPSILNSSLPLNPSDDAGEARESQG